MTRAFREALVALWRTGIVGLVSAVAVAASLLLVGLFVQVLDAAQGLSASIKDRVEVEAYLKEGATRNQAQKLAGRIAELPGVADVQYVDKSAASAEFRKMFGNDLLDALSENPLPASVRVRFDPSGDVTAAAREVVGIVEGDRLVESVSGGETWLTGLDQALEVATGVGIMLGFVLCIACMFAVSNTSKLMVLAQREAIEVMRLVGATGAFIRTTFLIGGAVQGMLGGCLAAIILLMSSRITTSWFLVDASMSTVTLGGGLILLGFVLGLAGSWTSLNRVLQAITS
jgi:cell division transport system permease protein